MKPRIAFVTGIIFAGLAALPIFPAARAQTTKGPGDAAAGFDIDPVHSNIIFSINHLGVSTFYGRINSPSGEFHIDAANPAASSFQISAKAENVDTNSANRDKHLKSGDFFDAKQFPELTFRSTAVSRTSKSTYAVTGDITVHGVTRSINVTIEHIGTKDTRMGTRSGFTTNFTIKRSDFGMGYMVGMLGDDVTLMIGIEGKKK